MWKVSESPNIGATSGCNKRVVGGLQGLTRRKAVDGAVRGGAGDVSGHKTNQLAKALTMSNLIGIGVGSTVGAGVYIIVGAVAREQSGPSITISFLIAGIAAALAAFCYAELASRCPSAGSAYHYSYICIGEGAAWLIGWGLVLEYTISGSAVARGISPNLALIFGGPDSLPSFLSRHTFPGLDIVVDPCAAILIFVVTGLLCAGIKQSVMAQTVVTCANMCALVFVVIAGGYIGFKSGWPGYQVPSGYFPFGGDGMLAAASTLFFAYIGFDTIASTAEEVKNPQRDLPIGIGSALAICCILYMSVAAVVVGLVPYYDLDLDTPISSAFASHDVKWAAYIIAVGACTALCSTLVGSLLPQPRIFMAMARDGLLPSFFSDVNTCTQVPVKGTIATGLLASMLAFFMDVDQLAGMVSVGTILAFTMVSFSLLILRYIPPDVVPIPSSLQGAIDIVTSRYSSESNIQDIKSVASGGTSSVGKGPVHDTLLDRCKIGVNEEKRRKIAGWTIMVTCFGIILFTNVAASDQLHSTIRYTLGAFGGVILLSGLAVLTCLDQDNARHNFGRPGGFLCPFVPLLPVASLVVNVYLLICLGGPTWARVSVWFLAGMIVYLCYGRTNSALKDAIYVPASHIDEIYETSTNSDA